MKNTSTTGPSLALVGAVPPPKPSAPRVKPVKCVKIPAEALDLARRATMEADALLELIIDVAQSDEDADSDAVHGMASRALELNGMAMSILSGDHAAKFIDNYRRVLYGRRKARRLEEAVNE